MRRAMSSGVRAPATHGRAMVAKTRSLPSPDGWSVAGVFVETRGIVEDTVYTSPGRVVPRSNSVCDDVSTSTVAGELTVFAAYAAGSQGASSDVNRYR